MSKFLNAREQIVVKHSWIITRDERDKLDSFFLLHDVWSALEKDFTIDDVELKRFLRYDSKEYEVILLQPVRVLRAAKDLGLSFRVHRATNIRVVLIKEWVTEENGDTEKEASANG